MCYAGGMTDWFDQKGADFPTQFATVAGCDLSVMRFQDQSHWLVRRDGRDMAEGMTAGTDAAKQAAELAALDLRPH